MRLPAISMAIAVGRRPIRISFCFSGRLRKPSISFPLRRRAIDRPGKLQKFGTDRDASPPGSRGVDIEADLLVLQIEVDDDSPTGNTGGVADRQYASPLQVLHDPGKIVLCLGADKEDVAQPQALARRYADDLD